MPTGDFGESLRRGFASINDAARNATERLKSVNLVHVLLNGDIAKARQAISEMTEDQLAELLITSRAIIALIEEREEDTGDKFNSSRVLIGSDGKLQVTDRPS